ncbi:MAG TPA: response regulator [Verrucomicrobiae bacterium]|nr:response regulator [Verrucomicrobiae bacterium]
MAETILVIDDDPAMLAFLAQRLAVEGYSVSTTTSGPDGIHQANSLRPDLLLLDLRMPYPDGAAVCKTLRANPATQHIPIIIVTGVLTPAHLEQALASGADDFVYKPVDLPDLLIRIRAMLNTRSIGDPAERRVRYTELARQMSAESARTRPATDKE